MEIAYKRTIKQSFMVVTSDCLQADYQIEMCIRNRIPLLLEFEFVIADGMLQFWYDITGKQSLEEYLKSSTLNQKLLAKLIAAVSRLTDILEDYLLKENCIQLNLKTIYIENTGEEIGFCYLPGEEKPLADSFRFLMENLLTQIAHSDKQAVAIAYEAYQMTLQTGYSIKEIAQAADLLLESKPIKEKREERQVEEKSITEPEEIQVTREEDWFEEIKTQIKNRIPDVVGKFTFRKERKQKEENLQMVFERQSQISSAESGATTFLAEQGEMHSSIGVLEYRGTGAMENLWIEKTPYHIGGRGDADGIIPDRSVSRLHARITKEEGRFFIEDLNSKNGTWVDGKLLNYLEKVPLVSGTRVVFALEEYRFIEK